MARERWPVAVVAAGLAGQVSAAVVEALPWPLVAVAAVLLVGLSLVGAGASEGQAALLRRVATGGALVVAVVALPVLAGGTGVADAKGGLGQLLVGVQVLHALCWQSDRDRRTALVVAGGLLVLGASYAPDVLVGAPLLVGWAALLVAVGQLAGARTRALVPATALAMALGLVVFLLVPVPVEAGVRSRLAGIAGTTPLLTRGVQGSAGFSGGVLDLRVRGDLPADPVARVDASAPQLWRGAVFDTYEGQLWSRQGFRIRRSSDGVVLGTPTAPTRADRVESLAPNDQIWSPGPLVSVIAPGADVAWVDAHGGVRLPYRPSDYTVVSEVLPTDPQALSRTTGAGVDDPVWLQLPASLPERVRALAQQVTAGAAGPWAAAEAISSYLRSHATYALDSPRPGPGEDAVDRFLFADRRGFCEQFASAQVVMLRALGVPARLVTGLGYGVEQGGTRLFRVKDLHAWVELWVPGTGWVTSDPTAGVPLDEGSTAALRARLSRATTQALARLTDLAGGRTALGLLLLVGTGGVAWFVRRRPVRVPGAVAPRRTGPALAAFLRLDQRLGARSRRSKESLRDVRGRLDPALAPALGVVEQECYAPVPPDPAPAVAALDRYGG